MSYPVPCGAGGYFVLAVYRCVTARSCYVMLCDVGVELCPAKWCEGGVWCCWTTMLHCVGFARKVMYRFVRAARCMVALRHALVL